MSLISPKNFVAPFTNTVNLATIIVVALLFGIYRLSGGGVNISSRKTTAPIVREDLGLSKSSIDSAKPGSANSKANPTRLDDNALGDLLDNGGKSGSLRDPAKPSTPVRSGGSSLDEIAKQLGVE